MAITINITIPLPSRRMLFPFFSLYFLLLFLVVILDSAYLSAGKVWNPKPSSSTGRQVQDDTYRFSSSGFLVKPGMTKIQNHSFPFVQYALIVEKKESNAHIVRKTERPVFVSHGSREKKEIALTFDADMTYRMQEMLTNGEVSTLYDKRLIQILTETNTKATLFLTGLWIETYPNESKKLAANPLFELASHSYSHPSFDGDCFGLGEISDEQNDDELSKTQSLLKELTGIKNTFFRFPGGCYSENDLESLEKFGLTAIQWDVAGKDGFNSAAKEITQNILGKVQNGSIIVLHMNGGINEPETANVIGHMIPVLREQGYQFVTVSELLDSSLAKRDSPISLQLPLDNR